MGAYCTEWTLNTSVAVFPFKTKTRQLGVCVCVCVCVCPVCVRTPGDKVSVDREPGALSAAEDRQGRQV